MSEYNMTGEEYDLLYKRYLVRDPKQLLELAGMKEGDRVLDLCSGANGRVTKAAIEMGASLVVPVDLNPNVKKLHSIKNNYVQPYCEDVGGFLKYACVLKEEKFNIAICQQAINYWFTKEAIHKLSSVMRRGAKFVFNTFNKRPSTIPLVKEYEIDGNNYVEVAWMIGETVHHVQICNNKNPHCTEFEWIPEERFVAVIKEGFEIEIERQGTTDIYVCTKRNGSL